MSNYISGGLVIILLAFFTLLGIQAYSLFDTARAVTAAVAYTVPLLEQAGGISPAVEQALRENLTGQGLNPDEATLDGTSAGQPWGAAVTLRVTYEHPYALARLVTGAGLSTHTGVLRIERHVTVSSEVAS